MNFPELRADCAQRLVAAGAQISRLTAFVGFDGFVDEIVHVVDKREDAESFERLPTIARLAERLSAAAGKSTNIELVNQRTKLGGNGPIMANALARFGIKVTYLGALGYPNLHPVFNGFAEAAQVNSIAEPGHTDALEFEDGKVMLGKSFHLKEVNWANIQARYGQEKFAEQLSSADLVGFVNWTMIPYMSDIWQSIQEELCPKFGERRRIIFFDLADPEKRSSGDISRALELIAGFERYFDVILGLNEKEAYEIGKVLALATNDRSAGGLSTLAREIHCRLAIRTVMVHPVTFALAVSDGVVELLEGPHVAKPLITTGAGDHFNSGFCLGKLLGLGNRMSLLTGVATSGYYVRTAHSPTVEELVGMLREWPRKNECAI